VTLQSLRDADAERLMDPGERLLGAVVATARRGLFSCVSSADRARGVMGVAVPAIERDLAGGTD
jgi:hypothetical protein